jgi:SAM-dependent methyltransferase
MALSKRLLISLRDRLGPRARRYAELLRVVAPFIASGGARFERECNICGYEGAFYPAGFPSGQAIRLDAGCPSCGSLERQRFLKLWVDANAAAISGRSVLHFAPENCVRKFIEPLASKYVSADIGDHRTIDLHLNIENIDLPDSSFDVAICSHILEHVDDAKALSELRRILKPGGLLLVMVPIVDAWTETYENPSVNSNKGRCLEFGQGDHVRYYGNDIGARMAKAGFDVSFSVSGGPDVSRFALTRGERVFICKRAAASECEKAA